MRSGAEIGKMMAKSEKRDEAKMEEDARIGRSSEVMGLEENG